MASEQDVSEASLQLLKEDLTLLVPSHLLSAVLVGKMKVFKVTAALLCFVIVTNALPTEEGTSVEKRSEESDFDEEKRQFFSECPQYSQD